jgi:hypothetical protein
VASFAREVARECSWDGDDIINAYFFVTKMQGSKVATMIEDLFLNPKPNTASKKTNAVDFSRFERMVNESSSEEEAFNKVRDAKDVSLEVSKAFREKYDPNKDLTPKETFAKFYREVKSGFPATVKFNVGDTVWQKDEKRYATVMNNYGDPLNGDRGDIRLDTSGNTMIFTYNAKTYENTGYNLVKLGEKGDAGKFNSDALAEMKESAKGMIDRSKASKSLKSNVSYYQSVYKRLLDGEFDSMAGTKSTASNKKGSSDYTYVPNKDVKELSVVVKGELKKLMGSDILDGVYVKNSSKSAPKVDANDVFAKGGGVFNDNEGFMKADNENNYRYPEMEVYVETIDEPIDLSSNTSGRTNNVFIKSINDDIDLNEGSKIRARMGYNPINRTPEKMMMVNQRMVVSDLPKPISTTHKND